MRIRELHAFILLLSIGFGCSEQCPTINESATPMPEIEIDRLEDVLFELTSVDQILDFLNGHPTLKEQFLGSDQYPSDTILAQALLGRIQNPFVDTLYRESRMVFGNMDDLKDEFERAFSQIRSFDPDARIPRVKTLVTGFGSAEMFVSDSLIVIGLDFYLGPEASFRPNEYPDYILERFQKEYIVPAVVLLLSDKYVASDMADQTMLADMVYYGKRFEFTKQMMPCTSDSLIVWYSGKELDDVNNNQHIIWANFLQNELLYETDHFTKQKFMGERPNTYEISAVCPGRIGAWVGWEIVKKYREKFPELSLQKVLADPNARTIFERSNYKGQAPGLFD